MGYTLSEKTAQQLRRLLNDGGGSASGATGNSNRQEGWVVITGDKDEETGYYTGTVNYYDAIAEEWVSFASVLVETANEDDHLTVDHRYIGQRSGDTEDGDSVWIVSGNDPQYCCGLKIAGADDPLCDEGAVYVDNTALAGAGINAGTDNCQLFIDPGCGITLEGGKKVGVNGGALAGDGLIATGCKLNVNVDDGGCLEITEAGKLKVNLSGTFSAITALNIGGSCPNKTLTYTTTAFGFNGCSLEQISYLESSLTLPCCYPCDSTPQYWCYNGSCSTTQTTGATGPFSTSTECSAACTTTDCTSCAWTLTVDGETYSFEESGGTFIAAGPDGTFFYLTLPVGCTGEYSVQQYSGAVEQCKWVATYDGSGCHTLEQGTNNGIPFTDCIASEVTLCCDGGGGGSCSFTGSLQFKTEGPLCGICNAFAAGFHDMLPDGECNYYGSYGGGDIAECENENRGYGVRILLNPDAGTVELVAYGDYCGPPPGTYTPTSFSPFSFTLTYSSGGATCGACGATTLTIQEV